MEIRFLFNLYYVSLIQQSVITSTFLSFFFFVYFFCLPYFPRCYQILRLCSAEFSPDWWIWTAKIVQWTLIGLMHYSVGTFSAKIMNRVKTFRISGAPAGSLWILIYSTTAVKNIRFSWPHTVSCELRIIMNCDSKQFKRKG